MEAETSALENIKENFTFYATREKSIRIEWVKRELYKEKSSLDDFKSTLVLSKVDETCCWRYFLPMEY